MAAMATTGKRQSPEVLSASTLLGDKVVNFEGEDLGKIEELMIDLDTGRINYVVLSFGGFLGIGDKFFAVPFQSLRLDSENKRFVLNMDKEHLRNAPGFDKSHWPTMSREWGEEVHRYYNVTPYWQGEAYRGEKGERGKEYRH